MKVTSKKLFLMGLMAALMLCLTGTAMAQDSDGDGVDDVDDLCPGTPAGWAVNGCGCRLRPWFRLDTSQGMYGVIPEQGDAPLPLGYATTLDFQSYVRTPAGGPPPGGATADDAFRIYWSFGGASEKTWFRVYSDGTTQVWDDTDVTASGTTEGKTHDAQGGATHASPHTTDAASVYPNIDITVTMLPDEDQDGVLDGDDLCPGTPACAIVDENGCTDTDLDGVVDPCDQCPHTPVGAPVDASGCSIATKFYPLSEQSLGLEGPFQAGQWADYNNDGFSDMFGGAHVYTNQGDGSFVDTSPVGGRTRGSLGDFDNDGLVDAFDIVAGGGPVLYTNDGDETWTNRSDLFSYVYGDVPRNSNGSTVVDINGDGYLDTYMAGWWDYDPNSFDVIYSSYSDGVSEPCWSNTWEEPSPYNSPHHCKAATPCDFDEDGDQDIYASAYWYTHSFLWRNDGFDGYTGLTDVTAAYNADSGPGGAAGHTQGSCWADFDNDGHFDLFIANFAHPGNTELRFASNDGPPNYHFTDQGKCGLTQREPLSSGIAGDYDNDGDVDLLVTMSGQYSWDYIELYRNDGLDPFGFWVVFTNVTDAMGLTEQGPSDVGAWGDYNNDGYLDLIANYKLWRNPGGDNHWLKVKLLGGPHDDGLVNGAAIGAQVRIVVPGLGTLVRQVEGNTGQLGCQNDLTMHFGLGTHTTPVDLLIDWPNGYQETVLGVEVDQAITIQLEPPVAGPPCWDYLTQCHGDTDGDGDVDTVDWPIFRDSFGYAYPAAQYHPCGDMDHDGDVDTVDWPEFRDNFGYAAPADCTPGGTWPPSP